MSVWISREWSEDGHRRRQTMVRGTSNVKESDSFVVEWLDPNGRRCRHKIRMRGRSGKRLADELADQIAARLTLGQYEIKKRTTWTNFRGEYERKVLSSRRPNTQKLVRETFNLFEKVCRLNYVDAVSTRTIDTFISGLLQLPGKKRRSTMSRFTANKHVRHLKAALRKAHKWGHLEKLPDFEFLDEPQKLPVFMLPEDFNNIYVGCNQSRRPAKRPYTPGAWWQAIMVIGIMAGLRINEMRGLLWGDVQLDDGYMVIRHHHAKAKRDDVVPLHPVAVEHLRRITDFGERVFDWPMCSTTLWDEWARIQFKAGIHLPCFEDHEHTPRCHVYGFHALKKACGTLNAGRLPMPVLNAFMRHRAFSTTDRFYLNREKLIEGVTDMMFVPAVLCERS